MLRRVRLQYCCCNVLVFCVIYLVICSLGCWILFYVYIFHQPTGLQWNYFDMAFTYINIWTFFIDVLALFITTSTATVYTRDRLLSLASSALQLNQQARLQVSLGLGLCRRGCRAGRHQHRQLMAACSVAASANRVGTPGEIPTIIGHRYEEVNNSDQLINRHGARPRVMLPVCTGHQRSSLALPATQLSSTSLTHNHTVYLCHQRCNTL